MVFKRYKGVIRTGNTLRLTNCGYVEQYAKNFTIEMVGCSSHAHYFEEQGMKFLDCFNVCYSLNKKRRWNLPEIIKKQLGKSFESLHCNVSLVELHCLQRSNNCVGFFTNKGHIRQLIPTTKKYLNYGSVINVNKSYTLADSSSKGQQLSKGGNHNLADDPNTSLLFKVVYPADIKGSNIYSNSKIAKNKSRGRPWVSLNDTSSKSRISKCKKRIVNIDEHVMILDEELKYEMSINTRVASEASYESTILVYDYLSYTPRNRKSRSRRRRNQGTKRKTREQVKHFFIEDASVSSSDNSLSDEGFIDECYVIESLDSENIEDVTFIPVRVVLPIKDVSTKHLNCKFGDKISFAKCRPRKFCIDIQNDVILTLRKSVYFKKVLWQRLDLSSYLVFSLVNNYDTLHDVYDVSINTHNKQTVVRIDTLYDMMVLNLEDVYNRTLKYIEGFLLPETFIEKEKLHLESRLSLEFKTIFPIIIGATNDQDINDGMNGQSKKNSKYLISKTNENCENLEMTLEGGSVKFCGICLKRLLDVAATSLQECGHWFCNLCWKEYLHKELRQRKDKISCPDCGDVVDYASMLTLANIHHIQMCEMEQCNKRPETICPNNQCGQTVRAIRKDNVGVCHCGAVVCLTCDMEGHWPATCDQYAQYRRRLDYCGLRTEECFKRIKSQPGKNCPTCQKFLVSKSRSPFMVCNRCKQNFCWSCLTPQEKHPNDRSWCYKMQPFEGTHVDIVIDILGDFTDGDQYYQRALESRKMRNPNHTKYMHRLVSKVRSKILWWVHKNSLGQKLLVCNLFTDIVDLIVELNFASEFCYVILEFETKRYTELICGVRDIAPRLQTIAFDMYNILISFHTQDRRRTLIKLQRLKNSGQNTLVSLLNLVCKHKAW